MKMKRMKYYASLFSALFVIGQVCAQPSLDFNDIKEINSESSFLRVFLENGFEKVRHGDIIVEVGYNYDSYPSEYLTTATYYPKASCFEIYFYEPFWNGRQTNNYESLVSQIKDCNFSATYEGSEFNEDVTFLLYSCPTSKYAGKIGYSLVSSDGAKWGVIKTFPFK